MTSPKDQEYFRREDAAKYLRENYGIPCTAKTLANYATARKGPHCHHAGRFPIYPRAELDKWARLYLGPLRLGPRRRTNCAACP
jgi:hypothetical protein